jgi:oligopeptide/dipeptide ABC transporter ATP-binding protein
MAWRYLPPEARMAELLLDVAGRDYTSGPFWARRTTRALDSVTLTVRSGETVGVLGESGSGKTTLVRLAAFLLRPTRGRVLVDGTDVWSLGGEARRRLRQRLQVVFQEGSDALDPLQSVAAAVAEPLANFRIGSRAERSAAVAEALAAVGLTPDLAGRHPGELSGGQRQRVGIARALTVRPSLLLLDEPVSALDVSVGAQVLNLLAALQREQGLGYVLISHELPVVRYLAERVVMLYAGHVVEEGPAREVLDRPAHPYTVALRAAALTVTPGAGLPDVPPAASPTATGCPFATRCPAVMPRCRDALPPLLALDGARLVRCLLFDGRDCADPLRSAAVAMG